MMVHSLWTCRCILSSSISINPLYPVTASGQIPQNAIYFHRIRQNMGAVRYRSVTLLYLEMCTVCSHNEHVIAR